MADNKQSPFQEEVQLELQMAHKMHPRLLDDKHYAYAVILEELDEFWVEVKKKRSDKKRLLEELIQVAAMAQRAAEDMGLIPGVNSYVCCQMSTMSIRATLYCWWLY